MLKKFLPIIILVIVVVGAGSFYGGMIYGKSISKGSFARDFDPAQLGANIAGMGQRGARVAGAGITGAGKNLLDILQKILLKYGTIIKRYFMKLFLKP